jgi:hypothetical protein
MRGNIVHPGFGCHEEATQIPRRPFPQGFNLGFFLAKAGAGTERQACPGEEVVVALHQGDLYTSRLINQHRVSEGLEDR